MNRTVAATFLAANLTFALSACGPISGDLSSDLSSSSTDGTFPAAQVEPASGPVTASLGEHEPVGEQTFASPQSNPIALSPDGSTVYVANTTSGTVDVIDTSSNEVVATVAVGLDPVAIAVRPDGNEVWVANHISDSVSVIDTAPGSATANQVVDTVQSMDSRFVTTFDEPVGIAFASSQKAYVALSSRNQVAVVDVPSRTVSKFLPITAQDPRAIAVADGKLFVTAFESNNQTSISACPLYWVPFIGVFELFPVELCTLDVLDLVNFVNNPNLPGLEKHIVVDPGLPDRDVFVFDTSDDSLIDVVEHTGTLLYGIVADENGTAYVSQTDARNHINGIEDGEDSDLIALQNRMFDNQVAKVECTTTSEVVGRLWWKRTVTSTECDNAAIFDVDNVSTPASEALSNPYGIDLANDGETLVVTAAGTSRLFTLDSETGEVLGMVDLGEGADFGQQIPRGVVVRDDQAYVLNTLENTVAVVDLSDPSDLQVMSKIDVGNDPTDELVRKGRIAFNNSFASDSGNFSCAGCHPDGNTDQLLWRIGGACFFNAFLQTGELGSIVLGKCSEDDEARSTMPVRGLKRTVPLHWDGALGDPFGGINGAVGVDGEAGKSCVLGPDGDEHECFRDLVNASQSGVMCDQLGGCAVGPTGLPGKLTDEERENMAFFLASVSYPPSRSRALDDSLTPQARAGMSDFFIDKGTLLNGLAAEVAAVQDVKSCGQAGCHSLPLMTDTNADLIGGFDVPTLRGLTDRWMQFSNGLTASRGTLEFAKENFGGGLLLPISLFVKAIIGFIPIQAPEGARWDPEIGHDERTVFAAVFAGFQPAYNVGPLDIFQMVEEMSTGFSGTAGRQIPLNARSTNDDNLGETTAVLQALEAGDDKGADNLRVVGVRRNGLGDYDPVILSYVNGVYQNGSASFTRAQLVDEAQDGTLIATATANLSALVQSTDVDQPLLSTDFAADRTPLLPMLPAENPMELNGIDIQADSGVLVDGAKVAANVECVGGTFSPYCTSGRVQIELSQAPTASGMHSLQVVSPKGRLSNDLPFCVDTCE